MASRAPVGPEDARENKGIQDPQDRLPTHPTPPWPKVPEVTQDSQEPMANQEAAARQETPVPQAPLASPWKMKMIREAWWGRWARKAFPENPASPHAIPAHQELTAGQGTQEPPGLLAHPDQMGSCLA